MTCIRCRRPLAALLVAALSIFLSVAPVGAMDASFSGKGLRSRRDHPAIGVTANLVQGEGESIYSSLATSPDGTFAIDGAPEGSYSLLVDTGEGAFLSPRPARAAGGREQADGPQPGRSPFSADGPSARGNR